MLCWDNDVVWLWVQQVLPNMPSLCYSEVPSIAVSRSPSVVLGFAELFPFEFSASAAPDKAWFSHNGKESRHIDMRTGQTSKTRSASDFSAFADGRGLV